MRIKRGFVAVALAVVAARAMAGGVAVAQGGAGVSLGRCAGLAVTILGTSRDDVLRGTPGDDVIKGLG